MRTTAAAGRGMMLLLAIALAATSGCSTLRRGTGDCQQRVIDKIENDHPQSRGTSIDSSSIETHKQGASRVLVTGRGRVRTQKGDYRQFTFSCVYNDSSGRVSDVKYQVQ